MASSSILNVFLIFILASSFANYVCEATICLDASEVCFNYHNYSHNLLQKQVNLELKASYFYQIYGNYFDRSDIALPGFSEYFSLESLHERSHADNLLRYINKRGGRPAFENIDIEDICKIVRNKKFCQSILFNDVQESLNNVTVKKHGLWALEDSLALEKYLLDSLSKLITIDDNQLNHYIEHEYLDEQIKTIKRLGSFIGQITKFSDVEYSLGQFLFDKKLLQKVLKTKEIERKQMEKMERGAEANDLNALDSLYIEL